MNLTHSLFARGNRKARRRAARRSARTTSRLSLLSLEERVVPSSVPVQVTSGAGMQMYRAAGADGQGNFVVLYDSQASSGAANSTVFAQ